MNKAEGGEIDPQEMFSKMFGGDAFYDYIGDLSLVKDATSTADVMMTPEEKEALEKAEEEEREKEKAKRQSGSAAVGAAASSLDSSATPIAPVDPTTATGTTASETPSLHTSSLATSSQNTPAASSTDVSKTDKAAQAHKKGKPKMTPEQKAQLDALEKKQDEEKKQR